MEGSGVTRKELARHVALIGVTSHTHFFFHLKGHQDLPSNPNSTVLLQPQVSPGQAKVQHFYFESKSGKLLEKFRIKEDLYLPTPDLTASTTRSRKRTEAKKSFWSRRLLTQSAPLGGCKYWMKDALKVKMCSFHPWLLRFVKEALQIWRARV